MLLGVDVGGTFTDAVLVGARRRCAHREGALDARAISRAACSTPCALRARARRRASRRDVQRFAHGMTVATNALLEGRTARTALIATEGFTDVIELARQARPHLYRPVRRAARARSSPAELRFAAPERMATRRPAARARRRRRARARAERVARARAARRSRSRCCTPTPTRARAHARRAARRAAARRARLALERARRHLPRVRAHRDDRARRGAVAAARALPATGSPPTRAALGCPSRTSCSPRAGSPSIARAAAHAALTVLSGPAGGVGGALLLAGLAGERDVLCFDMGGTSCDVCVIDGARGAPRPPSARSPAGRSRCPRSTSTPSAPAAARSPGATPAARCASARTRPAPSPGPPATARGGERSRP